MVTSNDALVGMKEICTFVRRSEPTVLAMIRDEAFPAQKLKGQWESSKTLVEEWRKDQIKKV